MTALPDDILREAETIIDDMEWDMGMSSTEYLHLKRRLARSLLAERTRTQKETAEACCELANNLAREICSNSLYDEDLEFAMLAEDIAQAISRRFLEGQKDGWE